MTAETFYIYQLLVNRKVVYIGMTNNPSRRCMMHLHHARTYNNKTTNKGLYARLYNALSTRTAIEMRVVSYGSMSAMYKMEERLINESTCELMNKVCNKKWSSFVPSKVGKFNYWFYMGVRNAMILSVNYQMELLTKAA